MVEEWKEDTTVPNEAVLSVSKHVESQYNKETICEEDKEVVLTAGLASHIVGTNTSDSIFRPFYYP